MALDAAALRDRAARAAGSFSPQQIVIIGLLGVVAAVGVVAALRWITEPSWTLVATTRSLSETANVVDELEAEGLTTRVEGDGQVFVRAEEAQDARLLLATATVDGTEVVGYELLDDEGFTTSEFKQRVDLQRALEGELTRTLIDIEGIDEASVHLAIPEDQLFVEDEENVTASVVLTTPSQLDDDTVASVVSIVASAVPGLVPENVTVSDTDGRVLTGGAGGSTGSADAVEMTQLYETALETQVETMLASVLGPDHSVVRVSAQLNFDEATEESTTYDPDSQVAVREQLTDETFNGTGTPPEGVLGVTGEVTGDGAVQESEYTRGEQISEYAIDQVVRTSRQAPGRLERLSVAVVLDEALDPAPDPAQVNALVAAAAGIDPARGDQVVVDLLPFEVAAEDDAAAEDEIPAEDAANPLDMVGTYAPTAIGTLVLLLVAFMVWRGMRALKPTVVEIDAGELRAAGDDDEDADELEPPEDRLTLDPAREVLDLIDRQPDEVAVLLRSWVADRRET
ncbi:MAG: flagellar basal-body MS-ring/collar protein FliF [Actinomycetota bacterium]|nr:flagellar basal-body MS-ring/collar protein FliF [Actinomycetota bacterium]